jgi:hypothetical protein
VAYQQPELMMYRLLVQFTILEFYRNLNTNKGVITVLFFISALPVIQKLLLSFNCFIVDDKGASSTNVFKHTIEKKLLFFFV